jgi:putative ABC transport system permease protein
MDMFKNYLKVALRNIRKGRIFSVVNILGLALGMSCSFLIFLYVQHETSYDRFHEKADQIYRVTTEWQIEGQSRVHETTAAPLAPALTADFPEVQKAVRVSSTGAVVSHGDKSFVEGKVYLVDPAFLDLFHFPLLQGNPETALSSLKSIVITSEMARKYFSDRDPMGQRLTLWDCYDFYVTGVAENPPPNTHLDFDFLVRFDHVNGLSDYNYLGSWGAWNFTTYVFLQKGVSVSEFESKTPALIRKYRGADSTNPQRLHLQPLTRINLETYGKLKYIYLFTAIAGVILVLACINFMNLAIARSSTRVKEIGMRKVVGAGRPQLIRQFLAECLLLVILALPVALLLVYFLLPSINTLLVTGIEFDLTKNLPLIGGILGTVALVALLSGSYPSFYLSAVRPVQSLRGELKSTGGASRLKNWLVVFQFAISIVLIVCTLTIWNQVRFIQKKNLGFAKDFVVSVPIRADVLREKNDSVKSELYKNPKILRATVSSFSPGSHPNQSVDWEGRKDDEELMMAWYSVDHDFVKTFKIQILEGRDFSRDFPSDINSAYLLNEAAVKAFGWKNPVGKRFMVQKSDLSLGTVVGVMKDFHFDSLHHEIKPLALILNPKGGYRCSIKIDSRDVSGTLSYIEKTFKKFAPGMPYDYAFVDDQVARMYISEERLGKLINSFSVIALFIACLGLLGLASFATSRRTKEIGIRKVLGASVPGIALLLCRGFAKWVAIANIIAWPVAYFAMDKWLRNFAYRAGLDWWIFLSAALLVLAIALLSTAYQVVKAAVTNPVTSLRYE